MTLKPNDSTLAYMSGQDAYALGIARGYDVATSRATSRADLGLKIEDRPEPQTEDHTNTRAIVGSDTALT